MSPQELLAAWAKRESHHGARDAPAALACEVIKELYGDPTRNEHRGLLVRSLAAAIDVAMEAADRAHEEECRRFHAAPARPHEADRTHARLSALEDNGRDLWRFAEEVVGRLRAIETRRRHCGEGKAGGACHPDARNHCICDCRVCRP